MVSDSPGVNFFGGRVILAGDIVNWVEDSKGYSLPLGDAAECRQARSLVATHTGVGRHVLLPSRPPPQLIPLILVPGEFGVSCCITACSECRGEVQHQ